jgi:hypothetical protein
MGYETRRVAFAAALEQIKAIKTSIESTQHPILNGGDLLDMGYGPFKKSQWHTAIFLTQRRSSI